MMTTDQFCLRWNNFQVNITSALESLKCDEDLVDVTLTCDGQNVKAHKVILSACSPYFRNLFRENPCQHPVVILKDVSYEDVTALLNFMYQGEVYITQDRLAPFLHTAELLQVRGLAGATNPFKESQSPSQQQAPSHQPKQQQHQFKLKKSTVLSAGQLQRVTPPLSISPSTILHQTSSRPVPYSPSYRAAKSPLVSPTSKDTHSSAISAFQLKDKSIAPSHSFSVQNRESNAKPPLGQSNTPSAPSNYPSSNEQTATSSYATTPEQQSYSSGQPHSATYQQQHASELSPSFPIIPPDEQSSSQPSSPLPAAAKRRKAFPRRLSGGSSSHVPAGDEEEHPKETSAEDFEVVKVVPPIVKQEPVDSEEIEGDAQDDLDTVSRHSGDSEDMEVTGFYTQPNTDSEEQVSLDQNLVKEEAAAEGASEVSPHSMLLRSLAGVHVQQSDDTDYKSQATSSEAFLMPAWDSNNTSNSDAFPSSTNWSLTKKRVRLSSKSFTVVDGKPFLTPEGLQVVQLKNDSIAVPGGHIQVPVVEANAGEYYTGTSYSSVAARLASRTLYQKRKHVWRSRRPVQCPNCQKVITMAYNLKSHLSTCLKRNGGLYRKT